MLEERLGLKTSFQEFLNKPLPARVGWPHVFGSMLLALFAFQFISGILLSFVYAPSPLSAYPSIRYLMQEMNAGAWLRGVHYWGASTIIVVLCLHLVRTFLYAAYKKPREFTWITGILLLLLMLAFAQTGFLLPWDQKSYWGTSVTIQIIHSAPWIGPAIANFLKGSETIGALTLSRFYGIHVIVLPLITVMLILIHLLLIRKFGITAPWSRIGEEPEGEIPFYPYQMAKDSTAMLLILAIVLVLAWLLPAPFGNAADPTDNNFVPRPEWYFLFLFQMLRYFEGPWEVVGTFLIPNLAILILLLLPFLDRNPERRIRKRPIAVVCVVLAISLWGYLTYSAFKETPHPPAWQKPRGIEVARFQRIKRPSEVGGLYVLKQQCFSCHSMTQWGDRKDLQTLTRNYFPSGGEWLQSHLEENGITTVLTKKQIEELMSALRVVTEDHPDRLYTIPSKVRFGANMFYNKACIGCHTIDGQGGTDGPDLTLRPLKPLAWHVEHIKDPRTKVPKSEMPPFLHYELYEYEALAEYILYLHTP